MLPPRHPRDSDSTIAGLFVFQKNCNATVCFFGIVSVICAFEDDDQFCHHLLHV